MEVVSELDKSESELELEVDLEEELEVELEEELKSSFCKCFIFLLLVDDEVLSFLFKSITSLLESDSKLESYLNLSLESHLDLSLELELPSTLFDFFIPCF